jgi:hypothetical protein
MPRFKPTPEQLAVMMGECGTGREAISLRDFDNSPFVYDRIYGLWYVSPSRHVFAMAFFFDLHLGNDGVDFFERMCDRYRKSSNPLQNAADEYLATIPGTAFGSSMSMFTTSGFNGSLSPSELRYFGDNIRYLKG